MATIVTRAGKGAPLTHAEVDANFTNLNTDKVETADIGVTVQAYDTTIAKYGDTTANFTGDLQKSGSNVLTSASIGVSVQAYDADLTSWAAINPSAKQNTLVSGTNIKTVNSSSLVGSGNVSVGDVFTTGVQTLTNKTLQNPIINGAIVNEVLATSVSGSFLIAPNDGAVQVITLASSVTASEFSFESGQSIDYMIDDGAGYTINWSSLGIVWKGGSAPTLSTTGYTFIKIWKVNSTFYGLAY